MYKFATIVLIPFPFTDLTSSKVRPAMIVSKAPSEEDDVILCFITSKNRGKKRGQFVFKTEHHDFKFTGLKVDSTFRFDKIATLHKSLILGEIGRVSKKVSGKMKLDFRNCFGF